MSTQPAALERANQAADLAFSDPAAARRLALDVQHTAPSDVAAVSVAEQALGLVGLATGRLADAETHLRSAITVATSTESAPYAAEARGVLGYLLTLTGRTREALRELERALPDLEGVAAARLRMQRALVFTEISRFDDAVTEYATALRMVQRSGGDDLVEATIRNNRSILLARRGDWRGAEADLRRAEDVFTAGGHAGRTAMVYQNRGLAATVRGDIPAALSAFDQAAARYGAAGSDPGLLPIERAEALLSVRLLTEARSAATAAVAEYESRNNAVDLVQARLLLAKVALAEQDTATAIAEIGAARRSAGRQGRRGWVAIANHLALQARWADGECSDTALRAGRRAIASLEATGWAAPISDARVIVARLALALGRRRLARNELAAVASDSHRGAADVRARAWYATALRRLDDGDRRGADAALRAGVRVLDAFSASLGATELRASSAGHARELTDLGLNLAVESGRADRVLRWAEHRRAWALRTPPARPPDDDEQAADLSRLRQVVVDIEAAVSKGNDPRPAIRRQAALEQRIRDRTRRAAGSGSPRSDSFPTMDDWGAALAESALVEYLTVDGHLHAVVLVDGSAELHPLCAVADVEKGLAALEFFSRRAAYGSTTPTHLNRLNQAADTLDRLVLLPFIERLGDRALVLVPTGPLHGMPWPLLPSCSGRPVAVNPSATLWFAAARVGTAPAGVGTAPAGVGTAPAGRRVVVAGPGLPHATAEASALARMYPDADHLSGRRATVGRVTAALDGAALGYIAAHGRFRADNSQFSSLHLADGPLIVHDLHLLHRPPRHVVLSACDSGLSAVHPGDELLGFAAALLALGTVSLVATLTPVPDEASRPLMLDYHRLLSERHRPAVALAMAQEPLLRGADLGERLTAAGFICLGAG